MLYFKNKYPYLLCKRGVSAKKRFFSHDARHSNKNAPGNQSRVTIEVFKMALTNNVFTFCVRTKDRHRI